MTQHTFWALYLNILILIYELSYWACVLFAGNRKGRLLKWQLHQTIYLLHIYLFFQRVFGFHSSFHFQQGSEMDLCEFPWNVRSHSWFTWRCCGAAILNHFYRPEMKKLMGSQFGVYRDISLLVLQPNTSWGCPCCGYSQPWRNDLKLLLVSDLVDMLKSGFSANHQQKCLWNDQGNWLCR